MITPHINAKKGDFAETILISGDPLRAKYIAENFLDDHWEVNTIRGMLGYTGIYKNKYISVMGHGIGIPSCSLYAKELITEYGVKNLIRVGSCGTILQEIKLRDIIIGMGACTDSKVNRIKFNGYDFSAIADFHLTCTAVEAANQLGFTVHIGNLFTTDLFYPTDTNLFHLMEKYRILGIEMETAGLYSIAAEYNVKALTICTVSDHFHFPDKSLTVEDRQSSFNEMIQIALHSIVLFDHKNTLKSKF
ncbi:MAG: purine-nucleoside phosphorylase [Candidatus Dasytiphilus stammeri]